MPMKIHTIKVWTGPYQISLSLVYVYVLDEGSCKTDYYEDYNTSSIEEKYNSVYFRLNFKVSSQVKPNTIVVHSVAFFDLLMDPTNSSLWPHTDTTCTACDKIK